MSVVELSREQVRSWLTRTVVQNRQCVRPTRSQQLLDELAAACLADGEDLLGLAVCTLHSLRVAGLVDRGLVALLELAFETRALEPEAFARPAGSCPAGA